MTGIVGNVSEDFFSQIFTFKYFFSCKCCGVWHNEHTTEKALLFE